jgi:hypothetical protein
MIKRNFLFDSTAQLLPPLAEGTKTLRFSSAHPISSAMKSGVVQNES